ncbi:heterokaryon incompatibility, partial [Colletotrichum zoysiae]
PIHCELQEVNLKAGPSYEALSYVWGSPTRTHPISCNGLTLLVTPNCRDALIHLRRRVTKRTLWIDAICIDQGDSEGSKKERNNQILQMGEVYKTARRVVIWLGTADQGICKPFSQKTFELYRSVDFSQIVDNEWFKRVWTIQEAAFARHIIL